MAHPTCASQWAQWRETGFEFRWGLHFLIIEQHIFWGSQTVDKYPLMTGPFMVYRKRNPITRVLTRNITIPSKELNLPSRI